MAKSKDLFDDTTMSFGEHLEVLRHHLWKAVIGLVVAVVITLIFSDKIVAVVRMPIDRALKAHMISGKYIIDDLPPEDAANAEGAGDADAEAAGEPAEDLRRDLKPFARAKADPEDEMAIPVMMKAADLARALYRHDPERFQALATYEAGRVPITGAPAGAPQANAAPAAAPAAEGARETDSVVVVMRSPYFAQLKEAVERLEEPITLNVQEAFMVYLKVGLVSGLVLAAPWIFYQIWLFVAAGLYPHEKRYVYIFLPVSLGLFLVGAVFCFLAVFPYVLDFLLGFNALLGVTPQIRLSEWISFAIILPLMFGLSFQLPVVMLFLERISVFDVETYRTKRRMAILVISIIAMFMTPADPMSMMMMMAPLILL
ncbi:MAG: twin-arginine translocase subunit TatC, partial [Planctomycetes bacterium]|nr:twin-arginine translocase subunit TatC [Planctomycetota bacterium]